MYKPKELIDFISGYVGGYYWFGTIAGQKPTQSLLDQKAKQYPEHYGPARMSKYKKAIKENAKIADCTGLIKGFFMRDNNGYKYNPSYDLNDVGFVNAASVKGNMDTMPDVAGIGLWKSGHVAVYVGNNEIIEAAGFSYGIRKIKLDKKRFTKWFYIKGIDYNSNAPAGLDIDALARDVIAGKYGNGLERKQKLNALGYGLIYDRVQTRVNELIHHR